VAAGTGLTLLTLKTMITSKLALSVATAIVIVGATTAIVVQHNADSTPTNILAPLPAVSPAKTPPPQIVVAPKVEAPKLAPAPAGNAPAGPNDLPNSPASPVVTITGLNKLQIVNGQTTTTTTSRTLNLDGTGAGAAGAGTRFGYTAVQQMKIDLETFKRQSADIIAQRTQEANGDPDKLAKLEAARQQYEQYAEDKQKQIDALEVQAATGNPASPAQTSP
jgi:hypothetical protein